MVIQILAALTAAVCPGLKSRCACLCLMLCVVSPSENSAEQGGVQALGGRESPLDLRYRDFVLGGGGQEGEAAGGGAEDLVSKLGSDLTVMVTVLTLTELSLDWEGKV